MGVTAAPDYRAIFEAVPGLYMVLAPDLTIIDVSTAYARATLIKRDEVIGRGLFDVFPDNPADGSADGVSNLRASLERVLATGQQHTMALQKYDVRRPDADGGGWVERWWAPANHPVLDAAGVVTCIVHTAADVTEQVLAKKRSAEQQAELERQRETMRRTNEFLEAVLENIPHMVFVKDAADLAFVRFNRAGEELLGVSRADMLGKDDFAFFPRAEAEFFQAKDRETLRGKVVVDIPEEPIQTQRGPRVLHTKKVVISDASGEPTYLLGISEDITERKAAAEARDRLTAMVDNSEDAIVSRNLEGLITSWNHGAAVLFGFSADEMVGQSFARLLPPDKRNEDAQALARLRTTGVVDPYETCRNHRDGRAIDVSVRVSALRSRAGELVGIFEITRDIREAKRAQVALAEKNREIEIGARIDRIGARVMLALNEQHDGTDPAAEVLRVLADEGGYRPLALYVHDPLGNGLVCAASLSVVRNAEKRFVRMGEGLVGEAAQRLESIFLDGAADAPYSLDTGIGTVAVATLFAVPLVHREQLVGVIAGASAAPLLARERTWLNQVGGQLAIGLHAIRQFQELKDLSRQLDERSRKIEAQNLELAAASRMKSEFLASMSHELRTPLNAIIGFSEVLKDGLVGELKPDQQEYITDVYDSGRHLLALINDILDLSKIEAGKMELDVELVDLQPVVTNALTILKERAAKGNVSITSLVTPGLGPIVADGRKLRQIVYNLLANAVKFTPPGGSVRISVAPRDHEIEIAVIDTGIGIAPEHLGLLFRPFEQIDSGIARRFEGTGLGLVMVKNLAELHGGVVGVESELGKGSRFWVRIPRSRSTDRLAAPTERPVSLHPRPTTVLVIDDDRAALALARRWLESAGFVVDIAETTDDAWNRVLVHRPDVILLDILFESGPTGWEFLERLRATSAVADVPVVIVSILADLQRGLALGASEVLQKPVSGPELIRAVQSIGLLKRPGEAHHILVVDDDPRSVEHVSKRLEQAGAVVTRAYGGRDALGAIERNRFGAMILDLMMPEVSGFDVLRELRAGQIDPELPVIILTSKLLDIAERRQLERMVHAVLTKGSWNEGQFLGVIRAALLSAEARQKRH